MMITEQQQIEAKHFRRLVKSQVALRGETLKSLGERIGYPASTITVALKRPWDVPRAVAAIKADIFEKKEVSR